MTHYTITEHSGLGPSALESRSVRSDKDAAAITAAGGLLLPRYDLAEDLAFAMLRYSSSSAIASCGVTGTFASLRVDGLRLWLPDDTGLALARLGEGCGWTVPLADLLDVAAGVMAPVPS